jgi:UDP-N-acetylglucosamine transferase subunit ALG13
VTSTPAPRLLVTVGTDHHPFDRLMQWIDELISVGVIPPQDVLVQAGYSRPPRRPPARRSLPRDELLALMASADVVVGHGGPGTVMDARSAGRRPVIVPRVASRGEVIDDHQVTFSRRLADLEKIVLAEDRTAFFAAVRRGLVDPDHLSLNGVVAHVAGADEVARRIHRMVQALPTMPRPQIIRRIGQLRRAAKGTAETTGG